MTTLDSRLCQLLFISHTPLALDFRHFLSLSSSSVFVTLSLLHYLNGPGFSFSSFLSLLNVMHLSLLESLFFHLSWVFRIFLSFIILSRFTNSIHSFECPSTL